MSKSINPNIGDIQCPICHETAAVRRNVGRKLYFDCMHCGRIYPNHSGGQRFILETARLWPASGAPADVPAWIREQWPYVKALRHRDHVADAPPAANDAAGEVITPPPAGSFGELPPPPPPAAPAAEPVQDQPRAGFDFLDI